MLTRRDMLKTLGTGVTLAGMGMISVSGREPATSPPAGAPGTSQPFVLPELGYSYEALEPQIDARTMEIHHTKHHQGYVNKANQALAAYPELRQKSGEDLLADLGAVPDPIREAVRNNVGGHLNHSLFWRVIGPAAGDQPAGALAGKIEHEFGSLAAFQAAFTAAALKCFGSGWAWLSLNRQDGLVVHSTPNQDSPLSHGLTPLLGLDVWEHAYYLNYQNRRAAYVGAFWAIVNWDRVAQNYAAALR